MAAMCKLLSFASSVMPVSQYCMGLCYHCMVVNQTSLTCNRAMTGQNVLCFWKLEVICLVGDLGLLATSTVLNFRELGVQYL